MTSNIRKKTVYKDVATGSLIPEKIAKLRDPATWVAEEIEIEVEVFDEETRSGEPPMWLPPAPSDASL